MPTESSPEAALPVRTVARMIGGYIARLGKVWVEGQVTEVNRRPGSGTVFLVLRDPVADVSLRVTCARGVCDAVVPPLADGARVVIHAKPDFHLGRGALSLTAFEIRPVGVGELLARLERLKRQLAVEGIFDADRKRPLPFLPHTVGLITGRASAAEHDVVETARARWPGVRFEIREVAVQGVQAVSQVMQALADLDRLREVEVIVIARGGGSLEDLLPFSDESLCRAVSAARTPVVSAIGHEPDSPLLDLVADVRAATPTDAARRVVPDVLAELSQLAVLRGRARRAVTNRLDSESRHLAQLRARPSLGHPAHLLDRHTAEIVQLRERTRRCAGAAVDRAGQDLLHATARVRSLSPLATLERGYAVVQQDDGAVVRSPAQAEPGTRLRIRLADGELTATTDDPV